MEMQSAVLDWYSESARDLAFRRTTDPWSVLVSEVIAQQTQAARAAEAWTRFISQFPTPAALASASPATAIRAWRGLGYNRRAVALRGAAIAIVGEHGGRVPNTYDELVRLPGIGPYTARAVLAIAFNQPVAALDTNIRRVLGRAFVGAESVPPRAFQALADGFVPAGRAATWTHALMDIGAAFCRARDPRCDACPLASHCMFLTGGRSPASGRPAGSKPFRSTTRWLRGRILDRLRDAPDGRWVTFDEPIGTHDADAVSEALGALAREGMLELSEIGTRARLRSEG
jgi:A/G-specific adenine glycosylase